MMMCTLVFLYGSWFNPCFVTEVRYVPARDACVIFKIGQAWGNGIDVERNRVRGSRENPDCSDIALAINDAKKR